jgi:chemotaxis-related protein WspB
MLFLLFQLGQDRYALEAGLIVEVLPLVGLKALPGAPHGVAGLVDYRGAAVPVIDLSTLALGTPSASRVSTRLLVVRWVSTHRGERLLGLIAERATDMLKCAPGDFRPTGVETRNTRYLGGVIRDAHGLIQRIDVAALLNDELRAALFPENTASVLPALASDAGSSPVVR